MAHCPPPRHMGHITFSIKLHTNAWEFLENIEDKFPRYYGTTCILVSVTGLNLQQHVIYMLTAVK